MTNTKVVCTDDHHDVQDAGLGQVMAARLDNMMHPSEENIKVEPESVGIVQNTRRESQTRLETFILADKQTSTGPCEEVRFFTYMHGGWRYYYSGDQLIKVEDVFAARIWFRRRGLVTIFLFIFLPLKKRTSKGSCACRKLSLKAVGWGPPTAYTTMLLPR